MNTDRTLADVLTHLEALAEAAQLTAIIGIYLNSPIGSPEEDQADAALSDLLADLGEFGPTALVLGSLIASHMSASHVHRWFTDEVATLHEHLVRLS